MRNIYIIAAFVVLTACKKDFTEAPSRCVPLPPSPPFGWSGVFPDTGYSSPCFNPENPDEIIYREHHFNTGEFWLCKLNLKTLEKDYIFQGGFWSSPRWGMNNWIIFSLSDANVYKIKSDGTGLQQLTSNGKSFAPGWSHDYNKIYYSSYIILTDTSKPGVPAQQQKSIGISIDLEGNLLDTLWSGWSKNIFSINDSIAVSVNYWGFCIINMISGTFNYLAQDDPSEGEGSSGIVQINNGTFLWSSERGVFITDITANSHLIIMSTCNSNYYANPTYSPQSRKVILEHIIKIPKGDLLYGDDTFVMMNSDGTEKTEIKIP